MGTRFGDMAQHPVGSAFDVRSTARVVALINGYRNKALVDLHELKLSRPRSGADSDGASMVSWSYLASKIQHVVLALTYAVLHGGEEDQDKDQKSEDESIWLSDLYPATVVLQSRSTPSRGNQAKEVEHL